MPIPDSIKAVKKPTNTRIKNINGRYKVILRTSVRNNERVIPIELGIVGEIINGEYVAYPNPSVRDAKEACDSYKKRHNIIDTDSSDVETNGSEITVQKGRKKKSTVYTVKVSGPVKLMDKMGKGLLQELTNTFGVDDARFIYVTALLRASFGEIKNRDLDEEYEASIASVLYPHVPLSEKTICETLKRLGYDTLSMINFWKARVKANIGTGVVVVDGSLLDFNSESIYSEFSRKGKVKGSKDALVLTAYSLALNEPLCEEVYPGNMLDMVAYKDFSSKYGLDDALVVARPINEVEVLHSTTIQIDDKGKKHKIKQLVDVKLFDKGYSSEQVMLQLRNGKHHFIVAIKNDRQEIAMYGLDNPCEYLSEFHEDTVMYKKIKVEENKFFYAFKCYRMGSIQNTVYVANETKNKRFSPEKYNKKQSTFGLIVFESDLDLLPYEVYAAYDDRWKIEPYEKLRKSIMENGAINVHSDPSARATTFISSISNIMGCRLMKAMKKTGLSKKYSIKEILRRLGHCMEQMDDDGNWSNTARLKKTEDILNVIFKVV